MCACVLTSVGACECARATVGSVCVSVGVGVGVGMGVGVCVGATWFAIGFGATFTFCRLVLCSLTSSDVDFGRGSISPIGRKNAYYFWMVSEAHLIC